ncbi:TIGR02099 family protein [Rhodoferax lacus]|uniref:TIGR02099 family protein n=1 Tax=Rhodoferax lacus TaxID=2184758 RepID=A0A3E1RB24_9BURK|nr:YhdP family protein [Rhodoferax lacus]RFO96565.1 TIGR02099 family protein [Rhodoferax lacus]
MPQANLTPSRWLSAFACASRWLLWILAAAWITSGLLWGGLHFLIVPRIGEFRPWLEQQASQRMGIGVRIGDIVATSNGLIPSVELRDVRLLDADGREALRLPSVLAALSVRSAVGLGFEQLYVAAPELDVRRSADGRIWIAGFVLPEATTDGSAAADWVFAQTELVVRGGRVRWSDELRGLPTLELADVDVLIRNRGRNHSLRVDADPPTGWGTRLSLQGKFLQPLFSRRHGDWRNWSGQLYAEASQVDLEQLRNYVDLGLDLRQGAGSLRAWVDVDHAVLLGATADVALQKVTVKLAPALEPLDLERVSGRLGVQLLDGGRTFSTQALAFDTRDGLHWPGGNVQLSLFEANAQQDAHGTLVADRLDLAAIREIASRLPLNAAVHEGFQRLAPQGLVEKIKLDWQGNIGSPARFGATGRVTQLVLAAQPRVNLGIPGLRGATVDFDMNQSGGRATLALQDGSIEFPGVFEKPVVAFDSLTGDVQWKLDGTHISVETGKLRFANPDAQGEAQIKWQTAPVPNGGSLELRFPGVLDLSGTLGRANLAALPRYLPLDMDKEARDYLAQALVAGEGSNARFRVKGDLARFPFSTPKQGEFQIAGAIRNASYAYAPPLVMPEGSPPWPLLTQVSGDLLLDHDSLQIKAAKGLLATGTGLQFGKTEVAISKLYDAPLVSVTAEARGPLTEALAFVNASPVGGWIGNALARTTVSGSADYKVRLSIPVQHADKSTVQGSIALGGNDFQFAPAVPRVSRAKGVIAFTEGGFSLAGVQARALGGDVRVEGAMNFGNTPLARNTPGALRMNGVATAEGLRLATELGPAARLAQFSSGSTPYSATLAIKSGVPELLVSSTLNGLALSLPPPFAKAAEANLPLRLETTLVRGTQTGAGRLQDQLQVDLGRLASLVYVRDIAGAEPRVLRGSIALGLGVNESAPLPAEGVVANVNLPQLDVDAWSAVVTRLAAAAPGSGNAVPDAATLSYLPNSMALRARELTVGGRQFNQVVLGGAREGPVWRGNVDATELNGYVEYRQSSGSTPGRVYARLTHLVIGQAAQQEVEALLDQQPATVPALDVVVEDMELRGKKLGRVDIQAVNLGGPVREGAREWRLNRFNISTPDATFTATGNWAQVNAQAPAASAGSGARRRTALNFTLDVADTGDLLKRLGTPGVIAKGKGVVAGQVSWLGSPFSPDYASMGGGFNVNMESGQFLKADPGIAKLLGVLSLQSLPRRLVLDFRDVFSDGFAFDFVRGDVTIERGLARTNNLQMKGVNAAVLMEGQADIAKETQNLKVVVIPEINVASASLIYSAINPLIGLTTFLANVILRKPLIEANTQEFLIDGTWVDPHVTKVERKPEAPAAPAPATSAPSKETQP